MLPDEPANAVPEWIGSRQSGPEENLDTEDWQKVLPDEPANTLAQWIGIRQSGIAKKH